MKYRTVKDDENVEVKKTVQRESLIHISNVNLVDPKLKVGVKIGWGYLESGEKVRVSRKSGEVIPKPDRSHLTYENRTKDFKSGSLDTPKEQVLEKTYNGEDFYLIEEEFYNYLRIKKEKEDLLVFKDKRGGHWDKSNTKEILPRFHVEKRNHVREKDLEKRLD